MRVLLVSLVLIFAFSAGAQTILTDPYAGQLQLQALRGHHYNQDSIPGRKWFVSKSIGISSGFGFFKGGNATVLSVPVRVQLNRRLTNNWYAFAGVAVAPAYVSVNQSFLSSANNKFSQSNSMLRSNRFDMFSRAELGLMYINDQKTFSISGSIGIEKSSYPLVPINQSGPMRPYTFMSPNRY